ncbi:hypothetical protein T4C_7736 [Trichinella pseudospiralis]|uniref:Uncharacterized protein n=1 Tax=Trichinella pseudospiralis TaxID=6337 RepID=A0A0V1J1K9_TRIPS|nr:hypothetical protein T4C_7736 [Trichinella pseudospiralis]
MNGLSTAFTCRGEKSDDSTLRKFWEIEPLGILPVEDTTADESVALKKFKEELSLVGGRYQVGLPWVQGRPNLPNNYPQAKHRLLAVQRRLDAREKDRAIYAAVMRHKGLASAGSRSIEADVVSPASCGLPGIRQQTEVPDSPHTTKPR